MLFHYKRFSKRLITHPKQFSYLEKLRLASEYSEQYLYFTIQNLECRNPDGNFAKLQFGAEVFNSGIRTSDALALISDYCMGDVQYIK